MRNKISAKKSWILAGFCVALALALSCSSAFAWDGGRGRGRSHEVSIRERNRNYYHGGKSHNSSWFGFQLNFGTPYIGAIIKTLPSGHKTIIVENVPYYYDDNICYKRCSPRYVIIP